MFTSRKPFRTTVARYAMIAAIGISFLTVAGTNAAGYSLLDSVKGFFGVEDQQVMPLNDDARTDRPSVSTTLVLSQVYGGGGGSTGTYLNDYVEIKNISATPQSLDTLQLMYGSALGNFASSATNAFALPAVTLQPGQYYFVQVGTVGTGGAPFPVTPDATTTNLNMSAANGKVALATAAFQINTCGATATPCSGAQLGDLVDWVAYGAAGNGAVNVGEGGNPSVNNGVSLVNTQGAVRKGNGCQDTDNNNNDFDVVTAPVPRNMATPAQTCGGPTGTPTITPSTTPTPTHTPTNTPTSTPSGSPSASPTPVQGSTFVLSQVDGGGGGSAGTYLNDYVEIKNISGAPHSLNGLSLYYGSALGNFASSATNAFALPDVTLNPGQYYLVQLGTPGTAGAPLPVTPDATTTNLNMSGTNGKVALVTAGLPINTCGATATPCDATQLSYIVDWVAYGAAGNGTAGNGEGGTSVNNGSALTAQQGAVRKNNGCQDTNNNNNDFDVVTAPVPHNSMSPFVPCAGGPTPTPTGTPTNTPTNTPTSTPTATATASPTPGCSTSTMLVGSQEVPPTGSTGTGLGTVLISPDHTSITVNLSWSGLTSNATAAHIHGPASPGTSAPILFPFTGVPAAASGSIPTQSFAITPAQFAQLRAGLFYLNVHSVNFPGGEIRGQILPTCAATRVDFDGDGKTDVSVFRPSEGNWYLDRSRDGMLGLHFGLNGDIPLPADYDGDGKADVAVFRPDPTGQNADYFILNSSNNTVTYGYWGLSTDTPLIGDYDGDGRADLIVYRNSDHTFYVMQSSGGLQSLNFGTAGDVPFLMDYDGDGKSNIAVFRPSNGTWYIAKPTGIPAQNFYAVPFGTDGDKAVPADYDGDGKDDIAVFRPSEGNWYSLFSGSGFHAIHFGQSGDIPVPGDYDGDGKYDVAVYRNGIWYLNSGPNGFTALQYGLPTDIPLPGQYIK